MNNSQQLVHSLQEYIVELQTQNRTLRTHIFNLQNKQETNQVKFHDEVQKLKVYIEHCQNEITKREVREVAMIQMVNDLQASKQEISKERDVYIQQLQNLRKEIAYKNEEISRLSTLLAKSTQQLPPKSNKCKQCDLYLKSHQLMQQKISHYEENMYALNKDIVCLRQFL